MRGWFLALALAGCSGAPGGADPAADAELAQFLKTEGQSVEDCFKGLPRLEGPVGTELEKGGGIPQPEAANRLVMAIDSSGSMAGRTGGQTKMEAAKAAAAEFLAGVPEGVEVGLIAFGHRGNNKPGGKALSCSSVETVYPIGAVDRERIGAALAGFDATGWTPLASAIRSAGQSLTASDTPGTQLVYVVSDGVETCEGDPVAAARALHEGPVKAVINIIGFDIPPAERAALQAVATAGGGQFIEAKSGAELSRVVGDARRQLGNNVAAATSTLANNIRGAGNDLRTGSAVASLRICVNTRLAAEQLRAEMWLARQGAGKRDALRAAVARRHEGFEARVRQYEAAAETARAGKEGELKSEIERSQEMLNQVQ
jgi:Ca-activated chloride channel family protein